MTDPAHPMTIDEAAARLLESRSLARLGDAHAAFRLLEKVPPSMLGEVPGLEIVFELAAGVKAWGAGLAFAERVGPFSPEEIRMAACVLLCAHAQHLTGLMKATTLRVNELMGPEDGGDDPAGPSVQPANPALN